MHPSENLSIQLKKSSGNSPRPKLDIKMPDMRFEGHEESAELPLQDKQSDKMNQAVNEADLADAMPSEDKSSSRFTRKQESFASDIITIQENSSIESVLDDSTILSRSLSRSKTSQQRPFTTNEEYSRHEKNMRAVAKFEKGKQLEKLSDMSREKSSSANSSVVKRSKISKKSNRSISKSRSNLRLREHSLEEKKVAKALKGMDSDQSSRNSNNSESLHRNSAIDESIDTESGTEIISELSHIEKSITEKAVDSSVNGLSNSKRSLAEDVSANVSNELKYQAGENGYVNDTFEDISSSTVQSKSRSQSKKIMYKRKNTISLTDNSSMDIKISFSKEPSNIRNMENIDERSKSVSRRKDSVEMTLASRQESDWEERGKVLNETRERLMIDIIGLPVADDEQRTGRTKFSSSRDMSQPTKSGSSKEKSKVMNSSLLEKKSEVMKSDSSNEKSEPKKPDSSKEKSESTNSISPRKKSEASVEDENVLVESLNQRIPQDVTNALRKIHRDAIDTVAGRHANLKTMEKVYESSSVRRTKSKTLEATSRRMAIKKEESRHHISEENMMVNIDIFCCSLFIFLKIQFFL